MPDAPNPLLADYRVILTLPVIWGDMDAFGHVNNTVFFRWFESARIAYLDRVDIESDGAHGVGPILAAAKCDFRRQVQFPDTVSIGAKITRLGRTSLTMVHSIASAAQNAIVAEGDSTLVIFDYDANRPTPIPDKLRAAIAALDNLA